MLQKIAVPMQNIRQGIMLIISAFPRVHHQVTQPREMTWFAATTQHYANDAASLPKFLQQFDVVLLQHLFYFILHVCIALYSYCKNSPKKQHKLPLNILSNSILDYLCHHDSGRYTVSQRNCQAKNGIFGTHCIYWSKIYLLPYI